MRKAIFGLFVVALFFMVLALCACDSKPPTAPTPLPAPPTIVQFNADGLRLQWTVVGEGQLAIRIDPLIGNVQPVGSQLVQADTYTITASNEGGSVRRSVVVK